MTDRRSFLKSLVAAVVLSPVVCQLSRAFTIDWDAEHYCKVAGIIEQNVEIAIHSLVHDLKAIGVWDKLAGLYPFVGGPSLK